MYKKSENVLQRKRKMVFVEKNYLRSIKSQRSFHTKQVYSDWIPYRITIAFITKTATFIKYTKSWIISELLNVLAIKYTGGFIFREKARAFL